MRHRIFLVIGLGFLIPCHRFINGAVDKGSCIFTHAFSVILDHGAFLGSDTDFYLDKPIILFFIRNRQIILR